MRVLLLHLATPLLLGVAALGAQEAHSWTELSGTTPAQWRVIWTEDPAVSATISWSTAVEGSDHRVHLAAAPREEGGTWAETVPCQRSGRYSDVGETAWYHHARVTGLEPSTIYHFVMASDGDQSRELHFTTAPRDDRPLKIVYGGDSRTGLEARQEMNLIMADLAAGDPELLAFAHGGDYVFDGRRWAQWSQWLSHHELCTTASGRVLPIVPVRGNHDLGPLYDEIFDAPGGAARNYYVTQLGQQAALLTLNSEISTAGDQAVWLEERLELSRKESRWLLAQYHSPAYPAVKNPSSVKASWVPLFEQFDVDLVLESDGHVVKRTVPIRGEKHDPSGVTYVGEGGLGVPQRRPDAERWYLQAPGMTANGHHVTVLEFTPDELRMRTIGPPLPLSRFKPSGFTPVVPDGAEWHYLAGEDPPPAWLQDDFDESAWPSGPAGFGYGDEDDVTVLEDMQRNYQRVYVRHRFPAEALASCEELALLMRYDDGFVAYLEGREVCRSKIESGSGAQAQGVGNHEARSDFEYFPIPNWRELIDGEHVVLALEGHNNRISSNDFSLQPVLIADPDNLTDLRREGLRLIDEHALRPRRSRAGSR